jgi:antitoxin MazE
VEVRTKVQKWGNSLGVRIPRSVAAAARLQAGASVEIAPVAETIVIRPMMPARYRVADLLKGIKRSNLHAAADTGGPLGRESF